MKKYLWIILLLVSCILHGCATYQAAMSNPSNDPINQKLPKMGIEYYVGGDIVGANVDFIKNIVNGEIQNNIINNTGQKRGTIEVKFDRVHLTSNTALAFLSGFTLFTANLLGMPISVYSADLTVSFNILNSNSDVIDTHTYSAQKKSAFGLYYGKDASICMLEATKEIMKRFRDDINYNSERIISNLGIEQTTARKESSKPADNLGTTALDQTIIRWDVQSRPQGADIFWRVVSKTPNVKSTNNKYLTTTPYEATKSLDIKGLTYQNSSNVRIILRCEKDGYLPQEKEYDVRMVLDQEEISSFFRLVKEDMQ